MKRNLLTWALALGLVLGGVGLAQTSRAADEAESSARVAAAFRDRHRA